MSSSTEPSTEDKPEFLIAFETAGVAPETIEKALPTLREIRTAHPDDETERLREIHKQCPELVNEFLDTLKNIKEWSSPSPVFETALNLREILDTEDPRITALVADPQSDALLIEWWASSWDVPNGKGELYSLLGEMGQIGVDMSLLRKVETINSNMVASSDNLDDFATNTEPDTLYKQIKKQLPELLDDLVERVLTWLNQPALEDENNSTVDPASKIQAVLHFIVTSLESDYDDDIPLKAITRDERSLPFLEWAFSNELMSTYDVVQRLFEISTPEALEVLFNWVEHEDPHSSLPSGSWGRIDDSGFISIIQGFSELADGNPRIQALFAQLWKASYRYYRLSPDEVAIYRVDSRVKAEDVASYLWEMGHPDGKALLTDTIKENDPENWHRVNVAIDYLGLFGDAESLDLLLDLFINERDEDGGTIVLIGDRPLTHEDQRPSRIAIIGTSLSKLVAFKGIQLETVADKLFTRIETAGLTRADLRSDWIAMAGSIMAKGALPDGRYKSFVDYLMDRAYKQKDNANASGILADFLKTYTESDTAAVEAVKKYEAEHNISGQDLKNLRISLGNEEAIEPLVKVLRDNLDNNFQKYINDLNDKTQERWLQTIEDARRGFYARMIMSIIVFGVGIFLVLASSYQFLFGNATGESLFGPGISFVAGLGTMFAVIYTGPLKEIRKSVNDLGSANMAFISYIHRVLEISNSFSYLYLKQKIDFDEMEKSSVLLEQAMRDTIYMLYLNPDDPASVRDIRNPTPPSIPRARSISPDAGP